jgi:hypothetical protein
MPKDWIDLILELTGKPGMDKSHLPNLKQHRVTGETRISYGEAESLEKITSPPRTEERSASSDTTTDRSPSEAMTGKKVLKIQKFGKQAARTVAPKL